MLFLVRRKEKIAANCTTKVTSVRGDIHQIFYLKSLFYLLLKTSEYKIYTKSWHVASFIFQNLYIYYLFM